MLLYRAGEQGPRSSYCGEPTVVTCEMLAESRAGCAVCRLRARELDRKYMNVQQSGLPAAFNRHGHDQKADSGRIYACYGRIARYPQLPYVFGVNCVRS